MTAVVVILDKMPQEFPEQPLPERVQLTPLLVESFCTKAEKLADCETCTEAVVGLTETEMGGGAAVMVTTAVADFVVSATDVAFRFTEPCLGTRAGAL